MRRFLLNRTVPPLTNGKQGLQKNFFNSNFYHFFYLASRLAQGQLPLKLMQGKQ